MTCKKAEEDAEFSILKSSLALFPTHKFVVVIGEDIGIFVILIGICTFDNVYFLKPRKGKIVQKIFSPHTALEKTIADNILFIDSMSARVTTWLRFLQPKQLPTTFPKSFPSDPTLAGNKKRPEDWDWERTNNEHQPAKTLKPLAPDSILGKISYKCKKGSTRRWSCRKARLFFSVLYLQCSDNCNNRKT
ncbi:hypothetical protein AVEN_264759-1 [Araneus ventricosus]|uniref:Uncharacterized protein n=1 Tax=Araneus ventricosus TaxID=182803 RepID=A0A4Y2EDB5_ARAVE|nr:hypothetical protein AVEN_264759-1 [Araneus ventricosus]